MKREDSKDLLKHYIMEESDPLNMHISQLELNCKDGDFYCFNILGWIRVNSGELSQIIIGQFFSNSSFTKSYFKWFLNCILEDEQRYIAEMAKRDVEFIENTFFNDKKENS